MKVTEHIEKAKGNTQFTFEILPPVKGHNVQSIFDNIDPLMEFNPPFIDVTYHREEHVYNDLGNGLLQKKVVRKRPGTVGICAALQNKYNVDAIPHILCGGFNKEVTENLLIDLDFLGINTSKLFNISLESFKKKKEINITDNIPIVKFPKVFPIEFKISGKKVKSILFNQLTLKIELSKLKP